MQEDSGGKIVQGETDYPFPKGTQKGIPPPQKRPKTVEEAAAEVLSATADKIKTETAGDTAAKILHGPGKSDDYSPAMMNMFTTLTTSLQQLAVTERDARIAAETSQNTAQKELMQMIAQQAKDVMDRSLNPPVNPALDPSAQFQQFKEWQQLIIGESDRVTAQIAGQVGNQSRSGLTQIDLELEKMKDGQVILLQQMQQNHEIALKGLDLQIQQFNLEMLKYKTTAQSKQSWWDDAMRAIGTAAKSAAKEGGSEGAAHGSAPGATQVGKTPAGLEVFKCQGPECEATIPVYPGTKFFSCPECGLAYRVRPEEPNQPNQPSRAAEDETSRMGGAREEEEYGGD